MILKTSEKIAASSGTLCRQLNSAYAFTSSFGVECDEVIMVMGGLLTMVQIGAR